MKYAILDNAKTSITKTGLIHELFSNVSFPRSGVPASFLTENNTVELIETLSYSKPSEKISTVTPYIENGKAYSVKKIATTSEEQQQLISDQWVAVRQERDGKLYQSDWRALSDLTMSDAWKDYRQSLRDLSLIHI